MWPCIDAVKSLKIRGGTNRRRIKDDAEEIMRINLYRGNRCGIEIAALSRQSGTPHNDTSGLILLVQWLTKRGWVIRF